MELVRNFLVNEELSRYCWALLYKRKLKQSVKNKFFHPVLVTYGPLILYYYLTQPATYKKIPLDATPMLLVVKLFGRSCGVDIL